MLAMTWNDATRSSLITLVKSIFPALIVLGAFSLTDVQIAILVVAIEALVAFLANTFKQGQEPGPGAQRQLQWNRTQLEAVPDATLALLMPVGFNGSRADLLTLLAGPE